MNLFIPQRVALAHLERLKPAKPECEASSISGVTIRSIMSVSTVKVGTTMKSMNPEIEVKGDLSVHAAFFCSSIPAQNPEYIWE